MLVPFVIVPLTPALAAHAASPSFEETPLDLVMLVDESGSLSNADVASEIAAAGAIAQAPLNPRSRVTIVGFGGVNGVAPNQDPISVVCQPTITDSVTNLEHLATCVKALHRRTEAEGDDTDYAAALSQAMSYLSPGTAYGQQSPKGATKAIFLMTDGGLDVSRDLVYTRTGNWLAAAHHAVNLELAAARKAGVEVWTLGFGTISSGDASYLSYLASQGAHTACDSRPESQPRSVIVSSSAVALDALYDLYAAAGCLGRSGTVSTSLPAGQSRVLRVSIPPIASAGAISVDKGRADIAVNFVQPDGVTVTGRKIGSSTFQNSGSDTAVQVLHITNPMPGTWQIDLTAPPGSQASQLVSATVFWQGAVRVSILPEPPAATLGEAIHITVSVLSESGPITDAATLKGIQVQVGVTGDGLNGTTNVPVSNSNEGASTSTGVGDFTGKFTAPSTPGTLIFTGTAVGYGLHTTNVSTPVQVSTVAALMRGVVQFPAGSVKVQRGQGLRGQIVFSNQTGKEQQVRVTLSASHALATVGSPRYVLSVPSGRTQASFAVAISKVSPLGSGLVTVQAVNASHPNQVYGQAQVLVTVLPEPTLLSKYLWELLAVLLLMAMLLIFSYARRGIRRAELDVRGMRVTLHSNGVSLAEYKAPSKRADALRFVVKNDPATGEPRIDRARSGDHSFTARRQLEHGRRSGVVTVTTDQGDKHEIQLGGQALTIDKGMEIAFHDRRRGRSPGGASQADDGAGATSPEASPSGSSVSQGSTIDPNDDPWLR
jgi:hypothetical protein